MIIFLRTLKFAYFCFVKNWTKILLSWSVFVFYSLIFVSFCVREKKPSKLHPMKIVKNTYYYERTFWRLRKSMFFTYVYRVFSDFFLAYSKMCKLRYFYLPQAGWGSESVIILNIKNLHLGSSLRFWQQQPIPCCTSSTFSDMLGLQRNNRQSQTVELVQKSSKWIATFFLPKKTEILNAEKETVNLLPSARKHWKHWKGKIDLEIRKGDVWIHYSLHFQLKDRETQIVCRTSNKVAFTRSQEFNKGNNNQNGKDFLPNKRGMNERSN